MIIISLADLRTHPYEAYASRRAGCDSVLARPSPQVTHGQASAAQVMVRQVVSTCHRIALATETVMLGSHVITQNLTFAARKGAELVNPAEGNPA